MISEELLKKYKELESISLIAEATMTPTLVVKFKDGQQSFIKMGRMQDAEDIIIKEIKLYRIRQRKDKISKILWNE